jgi:3-hydroxyisobutyrate dehydrogenase-like beta-hydroxyacid dehydrogenase
VVRAGRTIVKVFTEAALGNQMNLKVRLPATYLVGDFAARFSLALAAKDLGLAQDLAAETDTPMRLNALAKAEMDEAVARGWAGRDASSFLLIQEERARVAVRLPTR